MEKNQNIFFNYYITGFVDGEGCFSVSFNNREKMVLNLEVRPSFSVGQVQTPENYQLLKKIRDAFDGGGIRKDKNMYKYETRSLSHIRKQIIPFFKQYPLQTSKSKDFHNFCQICSLIAAKQHLNRDGLLKIIDLAEIMNPSGTRRLTIERLRAQLKSILH